MKKSLIALAVAGAMTAPVVAQADATLYGEMLYYVQDTDGSDNSVDASFDTIMLGVEGTVDNDIDGLETGFNLEWEYDGAAEGVTADEDGELSGASDREITVEMANIYMAGNWGQATFGLQDNPGNAGSYGIGLEHDANYHYIDDDNDVVQGIVYTTPDMGGFSASIGSVMTDEDESGAKTDDSSDAWVIGATYEGAGFELGAGYTDVKDGLEGYTLGGSVTVIDNLELAASINDMEDDSGDDLKAWNVAAGYTIDRTDLFIEYGDLDEDANFSGGYDVDGADLGGEDDYVLVGATYALGSAAFVGVEYVDFDADDSDTLTLAYGLEF